MKELNLFLDYKSELSKHTLRSYERSLKYFIEYFSFNKAIQIEGLTSEQMKGYSDYLSGQVGKSSVNSYLRPLSSFFNWLKNDLEAIEKDVTKKINWVKEEVKVDFVATNEEYNKILLACKNPEYRLMIRFMFELGLRIEELTKVKKCHIHNGEIIAYGKGFKQRIIPLNDNLVDEVEKYLSNKKDEENLFVSTKTKDALSTTAIYFRFKSIVNETDIEADRKEKLTPHKGRHYFVTTVIEKTSNIRLAQALAGHSSIAITQRYAHVRGEYAKNQINKVFGKAENGQ